MQKNKQIASSAIRRRGGAKKSLGQNFLKSEQALREIIKAGEITQEDIVLEIGPGKGALTERLLRHCGRVIAVEKDDDLVEFLKDKFAHEIADGSLVLVHGDILEFDISGMVSNFSSGDDAKQDTPRKISKPCRYKIIANIPYNITGAILKKFLTEKHQPSLMVLMVQYEVGKRIVARDNKESILSISVKAYGEPKLIMKVPARYFSPAPKVDSAIIKIAHISKKTFDYTGNAYVVDEEKFWNIVHAGFAHKRKMLAGNLKSFDTNKNWGEILADLGIPVNARAEDLTLVEWIALIKHVGGLHSFGEK
jgi:16S rRNA (adenine1518-N6/adenine1519-N6)-dimethyltransferase